MYVDISTAFAAFVFVGFPREAIYMDMPLVLLTEFGVGHFPGSIVVRGAVALPIEDVVTYAATIISTSRKRELAPKFRLHEIWLRVGRGGVN